MAVLNPELEMIRQFIGRCLPFSLLEDSLLDQVAVAIEIVYSKKGEVLRPDTGVNHLRIMRSGAVDIFSGNNELLDRLGEQECFNLNGLAEGDSGISAVIIDDSLIYRVQGEVLTKVRALDKNFDQYFKDQRARRLRHAAIAESSQSQLLTPLKVLASTRLISITPKDTVQQAARLMTQERVSSLLVLSENHRLRGIITDRDIRSRVVAEGLGGDTPITQIMTASPITVESSGSVFDAMMLMSENNIHHLPIMENNIPVSVVTTSDIIRTRQRDPLYLLQAISRANSVEDLVAISKEQPALVLRLVEEGAKAGQVSHMLCAISDHITQQLIKMAQHELGSAPVEFSWLVFGSQGRQEIALGGDQDNALVIDNSLTPADEPYFKKLAAFVCDGLDACGYPYCRGGIMATTDAWRLRLSDWQATVSKWVHSPTDDAVMRVSIFYDIRSVAGEANLAQSLQDHMLETASINSIFLAALTRNALSNRPPLSFFRRFVVERNGEHRDNLDLKHRGIIPVVDMARVYAIAHCIKPVNTVDRLSVLLDRNILSAKDLQNLQDALNFVMQVRLQHQCDQIRTGDQADNFINPQLLPNLARNQLRDAFSIIHDGQVGLSSSFSAGVF